MKGLMYFGFRKKTKVTLGKKDGRCITCLEVQV
jgi:hypothetical protein